MSLNVLWHNYNWIQHVDTTIRYQFQIIKNPLRKILRIIHWNRLNLNVLWLNYHFEKYESFIFFSEKEIHFYTTNMIYLKHFAFYSCCNDIWYDCIALSYLFLFQKIIFNITFIRQKDKDVKNRYQNDLW